MNKKGFTLVEIILAIALVMIVSTIVISNMTGFGKDIKQKDYDNLVKEILLAGEDYANSNGDVFNDIYKSENINANSNISNIREDTENDCYWHEEDLDNSDSNKKTKYDCICKDSDLNVKLNILVNDGYIRGNNTTKDKLIDPRNNEDMGEMYVTFCRIYYTKCEYKKDENGNYQFDANGEKIIIKKTIDLVKSKLC